MVGLAGSEDMFLILMCYGMDDNSNYENSNAKSEVVGVISTAELK